MLTKKAAEKITELAAKDGKKGYGLKLYVFPGGCSGFQYGLDFEKAQADTDIVFEQHGVKLFVDKESMEFLKGTTIDYVDGLQGSGFKIENPNVQHSCGCGKSFC
ncbi:MAG: iron-sulfur cluster assembly accessory protein [Candidatus Woesearchaeota archaeon]|nr:iron-sulfur cluster assembly accessory protein [Candidatus Woesearchaeota archaeon]